MTTDRTDRLALPLLHAGQAQKELTHNEALAALDMLVHASVLAIGLAEPPAAPAPGACWIVGAEPGGAWAGQADAIACWTGGGWRFAAPREGMRVWSEEDGAPALFAAGAWRRGELRADALVIGGVQVIGPRGAAIADAAGGAVQDAEARGAVADILAVLRQHGLIATA